VSEVTTNTPSSMFRSWQFKLSAPNENLPVFEEFSMKKVFFETNQRTKNRHYVSKQGGLVHDCDRHVQKHAYEHLHAITARTCFQQVEFTHKNDDMVSNRINKDSEPSQVNVKIQ
jgi:hypothetical protein